ncbi:hypothetical protein D3C74_351620 [compost metagenome]
MKALRNICRKNVMDSSILTLIADLPRIIRFDLKRRSCVRKFVQPKSLLLRKLATLKQIPLPDSVILVLYAQGFKLFSTVQIHQILNQNRHRNAVRDHVMHIKAQNMILIGKSKQTSPDERCLRQIKRLDKAL